MEKKAGKWYFKDYNNSGDRRANFPIPKVANERESVEWERLVLTLSVALSAGAFKSGYMLPRDRFLSSPPPPLHDNSIEKSFAVV